MKMRKTVNAEKNLTEEGILLFIYKKNSSL